MNEMIARVARAICPKNMPQDWLDYVDEARSAIEAMRAPTEEMLRAEDRLTSCGANRLPEYEARAVWRSMVEAALGKP